MTKWTRKELLPDWLAKLPLVEAPVTLGEETHFAISKRTLPLPQQLSDVFILPYETANETVDEFIEYIPCFRIEHEGAFHVCVYWRISLMHYQYFLAIYDATGDLIDRAMIAGTYQKEGGLVQRVAHINAELRGITVEGAMLTEGTDFDPAGSVRTVFEINQEGRIIWQPVEMG